VECDAVAQAMRSRHCGGRGPGGPRRQVDGPSIFAARGRVRAARIARHPEPVQRFEARRRTLGRIADRQAALHQHVADEGARDQRTAIDVGSGTPMHVGRAQQIRCRHAQRNAGLDQGRKGGARSAGVGLRVEARDRACGLGSFRASSTRNAASSMALGRAMARRPGAQRESDAPRGRKKNHPR